MTVNYTSLLSLGQPVTGTDNTQGTNTATNITSTTAQYAIIKVVGPLTATKVITAPSTSKTYLVINTDSTYGVTVKASGQTGVTVDANSRSTVVFNGTDYVVAGSDGGSVTFTTVKAGDGTAAAPSYTFSSSGNSDNGMYLPAANSLGFSTAGSERVRVDSSGNVGIGTGSPTSIPRFLTRKDIQQTLLLQRLVPINLGGRLHLLLLLTVVTHLATSSFRGTVGLPRGTLCRFKALLTPTPPTQTSLVI